MKKINPVSIVVAAIVAFILSGLYYTVFGSIWNHLRGLDPSITPVPTAFEIVAQLIRNLINAFVFAYIYKRFEIGNLKSAIGLGLVIWFGFQAMQIVGGVIHENYPLGLYGLHVGDALMTTLVMTTIVVGWPTRKENK